MPGCTWHCCYWAQPILTRHQSDVTLQGKLDTTVLNTWYTLVLHLWLVVSQWHITHESTLNPVFHTYNYMYLCIHTHAATQVYSIWYTFSSSWLVSTWELKFLASVVAVAECATAAGMKQLCIFTYDICVHPTCTVLLWVTQFCMSFLWGSSKGPILMQEPDWVPTMQLHSSAHLRMWGW